MATATDVSMPQGMKVASAWAWRLMVIAAAVLAVAYTLQYFLVMILPLFVALMLSSVGVPVVNWLRARGLPQWAAATVSLVGGLAALGVLSFFVISQVMANSDKLVTQVVAGIGKIETWLVEGPLHLKESQISDGLKSAQDFVTKQADALLAAGTATVGTIGTMVAGLLVAIFAFYFFLKDGSLIWKWLVGIFPKASREAVDGAGHVAWAIFAKYTQATIMVAAVDSIGIMLVAWFLGIPMVLPIGVLIFIGSFIPMVGGLVTGAIPVLLGLVVGGPSTALFMLIGVVAVQQLEGNLLQPLIMGRLVSVHPLAVLLSITAGFTLAGIAGALVAVPLATSINGVCLYLANRGRVGADPTDALEELQEELAADENFEEAP